MLENSDDNQKSMKIECLAFINGFVGVFAASNMCISCELIHSRLDGYYLFLDHQGGGGGVRGVLYALVPLIVYCHCHKHPSIHMYIM